MNLSTWDGLDLQALLGLRGIGDGRWRTTCVEPNGNGRVFGGQLLAQALLAAAQGVETGRRAAAMQFMFLQGADNRRPIDLSVTPLQDGKRFTSRHVRGAQAERIVCDAQVTFATPVHAPAHEVAIEPVADPESSMPAADVPAGWSAFIEAAVGHSLKNKPALDLRLPDPPEGLVPGLPEPRLTIWMRLRTPLPNAPHLHAAAFAYMSDYWFNYPAVGPHLRAMRAGERMYQASLNHALWLYRDVRADDWLLFDIRSPAANGGRGLVIANVHDRAGRLVANTTQECVMVPRVVPPAGK